MGAHHFTGEGRHHDRHGPLLHRGEVHQGGGRFQKRGHFPGYFGDLGDGHREDHHIGFGGHLLGSPGAADIRHQDFQALAFKEACEPAAHLAVAADNGDGGVH